MHKQPYSLELLFSIKQCFSLTTFQHKHQHKPNFNINEHAEGLLIKKAPSYVRDAALQEQV